MADAELESALTQQRAAVADSGAVSGDELLARQAFLERLEAERGQQARQLQERELEVADRDAKLTTAAGEHEMLKRLRERHRGEHDRELARREHVVLDEIASARFRGSAA